MGPFNCRHIWITASGSIRKGIHRVAEYCGDDEDDRAGKTDHFVHV
jgi:hypothetical protein